MASSTASVSRRPRVAILFPADPTHGASTDVMQSRFADVAKALTAAGLDAVGTPYADAFAAEVRARLRSVHAVLVWHNPIEGGRDRSVLNAMLRDVASAGVRVSAHPDVIDRIGTKEVLLRTRTMGWGSDIRQYTSPAAMEDGLCDTLAAGAARVVKQIRGQSGDGVWKVAPCAPAPGAITAAMPVRVRRARRGSVETQMTVRAFVALCAPYFTVGGMIDQAYQARLPDGMIRCYVVGDRVAGFGEQLVNALYPAAAGTDASSAPQPGPRLYFPPTRPDFQPLKRKLEGEWIGELCHHTGITREELPLLWDADFLYGPRDASGADTYVLCEINVSSVFPFPDSALAPLVDRVGAYVRGHDPA